MRINLFHSSMVSSRPAFLYIHVRCFIIHWSDTRSHPAHCCLIYIIHTFYKHKAKKKAIVSIYTAALFGLILKRPNSRPCLRAGLMTSPPREVFHHLFERTPIQTQILQRQRRVLTHGGKAVSQGMKL